MISRRLPAPAAPLPGSSWRPAGGPGREIAAARSAALSAPGTAAADGSTNAPSITGTSSMMSPGRALMTSATITVTLSGPPLRSASSTSRSARLLRVGDAQRLEDRLGGDDVGQAVRAEQVPVAGACLADRHVRLDLGAAQRAQDHRLARMILGLVRRELAGVDEVLDVGVVMGDLREHVAAQQVRARVADVHQRDLRAGEAQRGERRAHAVEVLVLLDRIGDALVRLEHGLAHAPQSGRRARGRRRAAPSSR